MTWTWTWTRILTWTWTLTLTWIWTGTQAEHMGKDRDMAVLCGVEKTSVVFLQIKMICDKLTKLNQNRIELPSPL
jgi:hypothetical protein